MSPERCDITFRGQVQGVGFRYTAARIAKGYGVAGWVRNQPDGSVRCVVEGPADQVARFVAALEDAMSGNIRERTVDRHPVSGELTGFEIRP